MPTFNRLEAVFYDDEKIRPYSVLINPTTSSIPAPALTPIQRVVFALSQVGHPRFKAPTFEDCKFTARGATTVNIAMK